MIDLTARQVQILRAIIEEFIDTAEPVGSDTIDKKYTIGVSPATIRNEMVYLTRQGYLRKTHSSAGRVPTPLAMKLYVNELMKEKELSVADEVSAKEKIWNSRNEIDHLLYETTRVLAEKARSIAIAVTDDRKIFHSGHANIMKMPEFFDLDVARHTLALVEEFQLLEEIFGLNQSENPVHVIYGSELGNKHLEPIGVIHMDVEAGGRIFRLAVVGSSRFDYPYVIPMMKYFRGLIEELAS